MSNQITGRNPTLTIGIPTKLHLNGSMVLSLLTSCMSQISNYTIVIRLLCGKSNIDQARSIVVSQWYDTANDDDLFLFIDSDQTFTRDDIMNVIGLKSDVACGIYCNSAGKPNVFPKDPEAFFKQRANDVYYAATGFMLIRRPILHKIADFIKKENNGYFRFWISMNEPNIIPFFKQRFIDSELDPGTNKEWLGEDYAFCWLVRQVGGSIKAVLSSTIGHEVPNIKYFSLQDYMNTMNKNNSPIISKQIIEKQLLEQQLQQNNLLHKIADFQNTSSNPSSSNPSSSNPSSFNPSNSTSNTSSNTLNTIISEPIKNREIERKWDNKSIVYYTGNSRIKWSGKSENLGGSETAVAMLSYYWTQQGYEVTVYGNVEEGIYKGVRYVKESEFKKDDHYETLILWRGFGCQMLPYVKANRLIIDLHDHTDGKFFMTDAMNKVQKVMLKSMFHRKLFSMIPDGKIAIIPNGVDTQLLDVVDTDKYFRKRYRLIYTSSYVRGLEHILMYGFPEIKRQIPQAELHIYYGRDLLENDFEKRLNELLKQPGVYEHGRISHQDLAKEYHQSTIHYYLTTAASAEIDCIAVKESLYAGCIPVLSTLAVFPERTGLHIEGDPTTKEVQLKAANTIVNILKNDTIIQEMQNELKKHISNQVYTWDQIASGWMDALKFPSL